MSKKDAKKQTLKQSKVSKDGSKGSLKNPAENEQLRRLRQKEISESLIRQNIQRYLKNIQPHKGSNQLAQKVATRTLNQVQNYIKKGNLEIPETPSQFPQQPKPTPKPTLEELRELQNRTKREKMQKKIDYLYDQIRGENGKPKETPNVSFKQILTKQQHEQKVQQLQAEKQERKRRMQELNQQQQRKRKEQEQREQELRVQQKQKKREEKRKAIEQNLKLRKEQHQKMLSLQKEMKKESEVNVNKERLYCKMEKRYQSEVLLPSLEEKKNKLRQLRQFHKNYDLEAIRQHAKKYDETHEEGTNGNSKKETIKAEYLPPSRSDRLSRFLQEQAEALKERLEYKKNRSEEMQQRMNSFQKEVKSRHQPKIDQSKKQEILQRYAEQSRKHQKLTLDPRKLGQQYLTIAKRMKKSERAKSQLNAEIKIQQPAKTSHPLQTSRLEHRSDQFYQSMRRKRMQSILNSEQHSNLDKFHLLRLQSDKMNQKITQKQKLGRVSGNEQAQQEAAQLLMACIKAKMGLMSVLKQGKKAESVHLHHRQ